MKENVIKNGTDADVVLSTRVRLARNIKKYPFPHRLDEEKKAELNEKINQIICSGNEEYKYYEMKSFPQKKVVSLAERHLISPEFTSFPEGRALILSEDENVSIMLQEEDHIRIQVMCNGLNFEDVYKVADEIDCLIGKNLEYAFDERIGYLTQCPTNLGTGMRASAMLHLPALTKQGVIPKLSAMVSKLGLVIRGFNGEGSQPSGDIYQISNQITLGISEKEAIYNLSSIINQLVSQERKLREELLKNEDYENSLWRSYGILKYSRKLSCAEFMKLISDVRLGTCMGIIDIDTEKINRLIFDVQPATISTAEGRNLDYSERDKIRASMVRKAM